MNLHGDRLALIFPYHEPNTYHTHQEIVDFVRQDWKGDCFKWLCRGGGVGAYDATGNNLGDALIMKSDISTPITLGNTGSWGATACTAGLAAFVFVKVKRLKHPL